jgi:predicted kinase
MPNLVLVFVSGLPGAGKTTISKKIAKEKGAQILDLDEFKRTDVDPTLVKTQIDPPEVRWGYYKRALEYAFSLEGTVILDEVFHLESLRTKIENLCDERQVPVQWIEVQCPYEVVEKRLRSAARVGHILSTDEALKMYRLFQEIFEKFPEGKKNYTLVNNLE